METLALHLDAGSDVRQSLEALARQEGGQGFVLSVVGNLSHAVFQCPGKSSPTRLRGELEIITLSGTLSPEGVHLHLSFSDGDCRVWGGHLEPGTLVLRGADLLVGFLPAPGHSADFPSASATAVNRLGQPLEPWQVDAPATPLEPPGHPRLAPVVAAPEAATDPTQPRVEIAVLPGCPWSARALRLLRTLSIPHRVLQVDNDALNNEIRERSGSRSLPQVFVDGEPIGGYDALTESHARRELEPLRQG
jgi:predicted DNA-binding protein with PD1-like motif/glutaredoxin